MEWDQRQIEAVELLVRALEQAWTPPCPPEIVTYGYTPLPTYQFLDGLDVLAEATEVRSLLDLGCGLGVNLRLADALGWTCHGVDLRPQYVAIAEQLAGPLTTVEVADIRTFDCSTWPVVYCNRPYVTDEDTNAFTAALLDRLAPGTLAFLPGLGGATEPPRGTALGPLVWQV